MKQPELFCGPTFSVNWVFHSCLLVITATAISVPLFSEFNVLPRPLPLGLFVVLSVALVVVLSTPSRVARWPAGSLAFFGVMVLAMVGAMSYGLLQAATSWYQVFFMASQVVLPFVGFIAVYPMVRSERGLRVFGASALAVAVVTSVVILLVNFESVFGLNFYYDPPELPGGLVIYQFRQYVGSVLVGVVSLGLLATRTVSQRIVVLLLSMLVGLAVFGMWSAAARIMILFVLVVMTLSLFSLRRILVGVAVLCLLFSVAFFLEPARDIIISSLQRFETMGNRFSPWSFVWQHITAAPFSGGWYLALGDANNLRGAHNQLLNLWFRAGLASAFIWFLMMVYIAWRTVGLLRRTYETPMFWGSVGLALALLVVAYANSVIVVPFEQPYSGIFIWSVYALVERSRRVCGRYNLAEKTGQ